jgi:hypothetical protein
MTSAFGRDWITEKAITIVRSYEGNITLRGLHYQLVALGMINDVRHYKKVVSAMIKARWEGLLPFDSFQDHEREVIGRTSYEETDVDSKAETAKRQIKAWATSYSKNKWENQEVYPEVFIEKKALQGVFEYPCMEWEVALNPCKGYPSITFLWEATERFREASILGKTPVIIYFGDYDCTGEDIPRSIAESLFKMGIHVEVVRSALMEDQVVDWGLPPAPTKVSDSRSRAWDGIGQVELDAVAPKKIVSLLNASLSEIFDESLHDELMQQEEEESTEFKEILRRDFNSLLD